MSCENYLLERKFNFGQIHKTKCLGQILSTNWISKLFLTTNKPRSSNFFFYVTSSFLKESLTKIILEIDPQKGFALFFNGCLSSIPFNILFTYSSNLCAIKKLICIHMFLKKSYSIGFLIRN